METPAERRLVAAGVLFAVGSAVHTLDHLRRGQGSVTEALYWTGNLALVLQVVVVTLIVTRHRLAAPAAGPDSSIWTGLRLTSAAWASPPPDSISNSGAAMPRPGIARTAIASSVAVPA